MGCLARKTPGSRETLGRATPENTGIRGQGDRTKNVRTHFRGQSQKNAFFKHRTVLVLLTGNIDFSFPSERES